jgi:hypothetical protein
VRDERLRAPRSLILVEHEVRLDEHALARRDDTGERAALRVRPAEQAGGA